MYSCISVHTQFRNKVTYSQTVKGNDEYTRRSSITMFYHTRALQKKNVRGISSQFRAHDTLFLSQSDQESVGCPAVRPRQNLDEEGWLSESVA